MRKSPSKPITALLIKSAGVNNFSLSYEPVFAKMLGSINAAILLNSIIYLSETKDRKMFYKFKDKPRQQNKAYKEGDSWLEVLGWGRSKFDNALAIIGTKITTGYSKTMALKGNNLNNLIVYWTDSKRLTWYLPNYRLLTKVRDQLYLGTAEKERNLITINTTNNQNVNAPNPSGYGEQREALTQTGSESPLGKVRNVRYLDRDRVNEGIEYSKVIAYFIQSYERVFRIKHPPLKTSHVAKIESILREFSTEYDLEFTEDWNLMVDTYFKTKFDKDMGVDYRIFHFASPGILVNLYNHAIYEDR